MRHLFFVAVLLILILAWMSGLKQKEPTTEGGRQVGDHPSTSVTIIAPASPGEEPVNTIYYTTPSIYSCYIKW